MYSTSATFQEIPNPNLAPERHVEKETVGRHARGVMNKIGEAEMLLKLSSRDVSSLSSFEMGRLYERLGTLKSAFETYREALEFEMLHR